MKSLVYLLLLALLPISAHARLGESQAQILARYGKPVKEEKWTDGVTLTFHKQNIEIRVIVYQGVSASESYHSLNMAFTWRQILALLSLNAQGQEWVPEPSETTDNQSHSRRWSREDGGGAYYNSASLTVDSPYQKNLQPHLDGF